jgi:catechol 2,3-dioxygenase-like lactoylglutathione lyase family enzyme
MVKRSTQRCGLQARSAAFAHSPSSGVLCSWPGFHSFKSAGGQSWEDTTMIKRIFPYADGDDLAASRDFYVGVFGLEVGMEDPVLGLRSPTNRAAQVVIPPRGMEDPVPRFGIDVGEPAAVDAAHAEARRRGMRVVYPLTDEPWGVRRFFVEDPSGTVVNVLAHLP